MLPKHVRLCRSGQGAIYQWRKAEPTRVTRRVYCCNTWRCEGRCARREASVTFARIKEACERPELRADGWVFLVLTLDRAGFYSGDAWRDVQRAFRELSRMSRNLMARLRRLCERNRWTDPGNRWVATVEAHRSGWPHVNVHLYCPELARELDRKRRHVLRVGLERMGLLRDLGVLSLTPRERREALGELVPAQRAALAELERRAVLIDGDLLEIATRAMQTRDGRSSRMWGRQSTAERVRDRDALASYMVKLAGEFDQAAEGLGRAVAEISKLTQLPVNAFEKFRRLRAGKGFLPPRRKNPEITGTMMRREFDPNRSAYGALPLHKCGPDIQRQQVELCVRIEADRIERERRARLLALARGVEYGDVAPPPVEQFAIFGANFKLLGERVIGDDGIHSGEDGFAMFSPALEQERDTS